MKRINGKIWLAGAVSLALIVLLSAFVWAWHRVSAMPFLDRKLIAIESDDWGMTGIRDAEAYASLSVRGVRVDESPWSAYTLETTEDLDRLFTLLQGHRDALNGPAVFTANFILTNPDYHQIASSGFQEYHYIPVRYGLPGRWQRKHLFPKYMDGIQKKVFYPAFHGREHFNADLWLGLLQHNDPTAHALFGEEVVFGCRDLWRKIQGPYFVPPDGFRDSLAQLAVISDGIRLFREMFGFAPRSTIAPGYLWNRMTEKIWAAHGIEIIQAGNRQHMGVSPGGITLRGPERPMGAVNRDNLMYLARNVDFEPWRYDMPLSQYMNEIDYLLGLGSPVVISTHSINYISGIRIHPDAHLAKLDSLLSHILQRHPDILFVHDGQLGDALRRGEFTHSSGERVHVNRKSSAAQRIRAAGIYLTHLFQKRIQRRIY